MALNRGNTSSLRPYTSQSSLSENTNTTNLQQSRVNLQPQFNAAQINTQTPMAKQDQQYLHQPTDSPRGDAGTMAYLSTQQLANSQTLRTSRPASPSKSPSKSETPRRDPSQSMPSLAQYSPRKTERVASSSNDRSPGTPYTPVSPNTPNVVAMFNKSGTFSSKRAQRTKSINGARKEVSDNGLVTVNGMTASLRLQIYDPQLHSAFGSSSAV